MSENRGLTVTATVLGAVASVAAILTFLFTYGPLTWPWAGQSTAPPASTGSCHDPHLSLSQGSGPSGTKVTVTGTGFPGSEHIEVSLHTEAMAPALSDGNGAFSDDVVIPGTLDTFAPMQFDIVAASTSGCSAHTPFGLERH